MCGNNKDFFFWQWLSAPGSLVQSWTWLTVCVEFCMFFTSPFQLLSGSVFFTHPKTTCYTKMPLMNLCICVSTMPCDRQSTPTILGIYSSSPVALTRIKRLLKLITSGDQYVPLDFLCMCVLSKQIFCSFLSTRRSTEILLITVSLMMHWIWRLEWKMTILKMKRKSYLMQIVSVGICALQTSWCFWAIN